MLFGCAGNSGGGNGKANLLGITISGAAPLTLPASGGPVTLQLTVKASGSNLPDNPPIAWSVEKGGAATTDATVSENGLFSASVAGSYTVKASYTLESVTKTGQVTIAVSPYGNGQTPSSGLTGVTVSGAKTLYLPESGPATLQLSAVPAGTNLPSDIAFTWSVEKDGAATTDATVSKAGSFSSQVAGTYTVKASATVDGVTQTGQVTVAVRAGVSLTIPDDLAGLIAEVENAVKEIDSVKKSIATSYALREAKTAGAGDTQKEALAKAYAQAFAGYDGPDYSVITETGPIWSAGAYANAAPYYLFTMTVAFSLADGKIADVIYALPEVPVLGRKIGNTGTTTEPEYWQYWTTTAPGGVNTNNYQDVMNHFIGMDAKTVATFTKPPNTAGVLYRSNGVNSAPLIRSDCTETARNATSSIVACAGAFIKSDAGKAFA